MRILPCFQRFPLRTREIYEIDTWYFSAFPPDYNDCPMLFFSLNLHQLRLPMFLLSRFGIHSETVKKKNTVIHHCAKIRTVPGQLPAVWTMPGSVW
jgi:hypothetical protein